MEGLSRSPWRDAPPAHFIFRIESFSTLSSSSFERFETSEFVAGECKWKLALYPNGNKSQGIEDHVSLYLVLVDKGSLKINKAIAVSYVLLVFDHSRDRYFSLQEISRFVGNKFEMGFDKFLPLKIFKDPSNGYLMDDSCMFGADLYFNTMVDKDPKLQCLSMLTSKPAPFKYTWKVESFSGIRDNRHCSKTFTTRSHDWNMVLYPRGYALYGDIGLLLYLVDPGKLKVFVEFKLRIVNQINKKHKTVEHRGCFSLPHQNIAAILSYLVQI